MKQKRKLVTISICILFAFSALVIGNQLLKTSGTVSLFVFLAGFLLLFLGVWKLLYPQRVKKSLLNGLLLLFLGLLIVFLSMWLPAILYSFS